MGVIDGPFRIDTDVAAAGNALDVTDGMSSGFRCVSEGHEILHHFHWGDLAGVDGLIYRKSIDGGQTFLDPQVISGVGVRGLPAVWADWWNGGTGTKIHITFVDSGTKGVYYISLDTSTGQTGSIVFAYDGNGIRMNALPGPVITKMSNGLLVIAFNDGADGGVWLMSKDDGASWYVVADQPLLGEDLGSVDIGAWAIAEVGTDDRLWMVVKDLGDTALYEWLVDFDDDKNQGLRIGDDTVSADINGTNQYGQTFQVSTAHYLKMVKFKCYRVGSPGNCVMSLYATSGGLPTGAALATVTVNGNNFTTNTAGEWEYFFLSPKYATQLTATTTYAIALDCATGTATDYVRILVDSGNGYANGQAVSYNGTVWSAVTGSDCMFVEAEFYVNSKEKATITPAPTTFTVLLGATALCALRNPSDGYTYLVDNGGGSDGTGSIYCKRMDPATNTWAARTTVLTTDGVADTSVDVSMAIDEGNGDLFVVYNYNNTTVTVVDFDVYFKKSTDGGNTWDTAVKLPTGAIDDHRWPRTNAYVETGIAGTGAVVYVEYGNDDLNDYYGVWLDFTYPYPDLETDFTPLLAFDTQAEWEAWYDGPGPDNTPLIVSDGLWFADWKNGLDSPYLAGAQQAAGYTLIGAPVDITGLAMSLTIKVEAPAFMQTLANRGMFIRLYDNQTPTAGWAEWDILGSDTAETGWQTILVSGDRTPDAQSVTPTFDKTKCNMFGIRVTTAVKDNKDVERFVLRDFSLGSQLIIKGGASGDKLDFEKVRGWSDFFGYGLFSRLGDLFVSVAKIIFGDSTGAVDTYFEDTNKVLQFSPGGFGNNYYEISFVGVASKTFDVKLGDFVTSGDQKSGFSGCTISTAPDRLGNADKVSITINDPDAVPAIAGCKFLNIQDMTLGIIIDSYAEENQDGDQDLYSGSVVRAAQSFTGLAKKLYEGRFYLRKVGSPTGDVVVKLYSDSAGTPNTILATSETVDIAEIGTSFETVLFEFRGTEIYTLSAATTYWLSVEYSGGDASNRLEVGYDNSTPTHAGTCKTYTSSWSAAQTFDLIFYAAGGDNEPLIDSSVEVTQPIEVNNAIIGSGKFVNAPIGALKIDSVADAAAIKNVQLVNNGKAILIKNAGTYTFDNWKFFTNTVDVSSSVEAVLVDSYAPTEDGDVDVYSGSITRVAQQFTATAGDLSRAIWSIRKQGTPTGNIVAKLYANSAGAPTGTALATSETVDIASLTTTFADVGFEFWDEYTMSAATEYHISIEYTGGDATNRLEVEYLTAGDAGETCNTYISSWSSQTYDCRFQVNRDGIVEILAVNGSDPSVTEVTASVQGAVIITNAVTLTVTCRNTAGLAIEGVRIRIETDPGGNLISEGTTNSSGVFTDSYNYVGDQNVKIIARLKGYVNNSAASTIASTGLSVPFTMVRDQAVNLP